MSGLFVHWATFGPVGLFGPMLFAILMSDGFDGSYDFYGFWGFIGFDKAIVTCESAPTMRPLPSTSHGKVAVSQFGGRSPIANPEADGRLSIRRPKSFTGSEADCRSGGRWPFTDQEAECRLWVRRLIVVWRFRGRWSFDGFWNNCRAQFQR